MTTARLARIVPGALALAALLAGAGPPGPKPVRIMPMGDSLTQAAPGYRGPLSSLLAEAGHRVEFVGSIADDPKDPASPRHEGHGGFTIGPGRSKADAWAGGKGNLSDNLDAWLKEEPDVILLLVGTNDFFNVGDLQPGYDPNAGGPGRLAALLDKVHAISPRTRVVVSSILPVAWDPDFARPFNRALPGVVASRPYARFADLGRAVGFVEGDWSPDKLHPTDRGYAKLARAWFEALRPILDEKPG